MKQNLDIHFFRKRLTKRLIELNELAEFGDAAARPVELDQTRVLQNGCNASTGYVDRGETKKTK
jgi:hypothetical protein